MSWHHAKPSSKLRHAPHLTTAAVAAIVLLALGACTSTTSTSTTASPAPVLATASTIPAGHPGAPYRGRLNRGRTAPSDWPMGPDRGRPAYAAVLVHPREAHQDSGG